MLARGQLCIMGARHPQGAEGAYGEARGERERLLQVLNGVDQLMFLPTGVVWIRADSASSSVLTLRSYS